MMLKDLPPFLDDLTEPQYANLLFDSSCDVSLSRHLRISNYFLTCLVQECGKYPTNTVQWEARVRLCKHCLQDGSMYVW